MRGDIGDIGSVCGVRIFSWYVTCRGGDIGDIGSVCGVRVFSWYVIYRGEIHRVSVWGQDLQLVRHLYGRHIGDIGSVCGVRVGSGSSAGTSPIWGTYRGYRVSVWGQCGVRIFSWYVTCMGEIWGQCVGLKGGQDLQLVRHLYGGDIGDIGSVYGIKGGSGSSTGTSSGWGR